MTEKAKSYKYKLDEVLGSLEMPGSPSNLYDPIRYFLSIGGKRMRPVLTLLTKDLYSKSEINDIRVAASIELFHNFTLLHDDIMDEAPLRRGLETVHEKWDQNVGILSGDALMVQSYQLLGEVKDDFLKIFQKFNSTALEVCEGQQMDMDFENSVEPSSDEYLQMIRLKTAVLIGYSIWLGGKLGKASNEDLKSLYELGTEVGIGFQIMDDFLDVFGNPESFGKTQGGDILAGKKTILWLIAMENGSEQHKNQLNSIYGLDKRGQEQVHEVIKIFKQNNVDQKVEALIEEKFHSAGQRIDALQGAQEAKTALKEYLQLLARRTF